MTAPLGRRRAAVVRAQRYGPYLVLAVADETAPRAGQFYMLAAAERWGGGEDERPFLPRAFSVARATDGELHFMLDDVGPGTARLYELGPGDEVWLAGPFGNPFLPPRHGRRPLLVGGGVGTAPLAILQDELGADTTVLLGFRSSGFALGAELVSGAQVATDDGSMGHRGFVTELLREELDRDPHVEVYACGPPLMLEAIRALCAERDVPAQLALESGMACGFGACFGCVVETRSGYVRLCVDGPVLDAAELEEVHAH